MNHLTVWLSIIVVALIAVCVYLWRRGIFYAPVTGWMHVSSVDEDGNQIDKGKWHRIPKPDKIERNGLNHVVKYVARLIISPSPQCSLIISSPDGNAACLIMRYEGQLKIMEHVMLGSSSRVKKGYKGPTLPPQSAQPEKEEALLKLFAELEIAPDMDMVHDYNGYADAMRDLHYPIGNEVSQATRIIQRLLCEVYHVQEADGLDFTFEER